MQLVISTDLDGTLIDHHDYSFDAALPALAKCREARVPVIFNTSKNAAEVVALQNLIGVEGPFIAENGSALICSDERIVFGVDRSEVLKFIAAFKLEHGDIIKGFNDWDVNDIMLHTQLNKTAASLAMVKQYSEPFLWHGDEPLLEELASSAAAQGFSLSKGGRFYHLQGTCDKATPLNYLKENPQLIFAGDASINLVCLGDNHNDLAMLACADIAVCVKSPVTDFPQLQTSRGQQRIYTQQYGPMGWNAAVEEILARYC